MPITAAPEILTHVACTHCGDACPDEPILLADQPTLHFCCAGCRAVYELLDASNLCTYYRLDDRAGQKVKEVELPCRFDYLDLESVQSQLLAFRSPTLARLTLSIPQMHCASCIWLLENLFKLNAGIRESRVNFLRKELTVSYEPATTSLKDVVTLLAAINYEPQITLAELGAQPHAANRTLYYQLGVAAFGFGNVMLLAFPDYFSFTEGLQATFGRFFGWLSLLLALPVLLVSARGFYQSAWQGLRQRYINLDFPISLGLTALFTTSVFDVLTQRGPGYFDSFTGLVFFMLIGKWVQQHSYDALRFDRDFTSYFPVAVTRLTKTGEQSVSVKELQAGQRIRVRHQEIIPADAVLLRGVGLIDYSFVSGESVPVAKAVGEVVYAGGRQVGEAVELEVVREVSQGYLTQLWNNPAFEKAGRPTLETYANHVGRYFVALTLTLALGSVLYWYPKDPQMALRAFTSVLIIACPCALSLATPFAMGAALRVLGRRQLYLKNAAVIETLSRADTLVFDKTGTLTDAQRATVRFAGPTLSADDAQRVAALVRQSTHPLSQRIAEQLGASPFSVTNCQETPGQGIRGLVAGVKVCVGAASFIGASATELAGPDQATRVYVALEGQLAGWYEVQSEYREHLADLLGELGQRYQLVLLTGDNNADVIRLRQLFGAGAELRFQQSPLDKLAFVENLQQQGRRVVMVGDGLNDAGALQRADVGIALTETLTNFSPASDAILEAGSFGRLATILRFARNCRHIVLATFGLSFCYNGIGLGLAVQGLLTPIASAILMPISSLSVMVFATLLVRYAAHRRGL
ncbi:heavy metal translocating P-type ATPase metal-binding domain-containing protein [Hymenobacter sp. BT683]|uniref:Heavy metal translocating P-type ATPase metal-binding domain-containing protein n=1 Tax=Hymenobacter jeongseonensis TaxID=2791027 RepID=A0ABS0IN55_9BACT|nr:heavy metal translocating P-type ATPase metal-binding domain-containing protein [Hymenobacter jeongseonensis]MBF9239318.1 heavy metal translocating P-type ATPase metal-binding domain-containing protein [Hymenobacter jeongseonensis]